MKRCSKCKKVLPFLEFNKDKQTKTGYASRCRICSKAGKKEYYEQVGRKRQYKWSQSEHGKRINRKNFWRREYGITEEQFFELYNTQNGVCAICGKPETRKSNVGNIKMLAVDHDHETKQIRGLLCHACNTMLGMAEDDKAILLKAAIYLEKKGV